MEPAMLRLWHRSYRDLPLFSMKREKKRPAQLTLANGFTLLRAERPETKVCRTLAGFDARLSSCSSDGVSEHCFFRPTLTTSARHDQLPIGIETRKRFRLLRGRGCLLPCPGPIGNQDRRDSAAHRSRVADRRFLQGGLRSRLRRVEQERRLERRRQEDEAQSHVARRYEHAGYRRLPGRSSYQQREGELPSRHLRDEPGGSAERGGGAERDSVRERGRGRHGHLQAWLQMGVRPPLSGGDP